MDARLVYVLGSCLVRRLQGVFAQEEGTLNENVHVQAAATLMPAPYPGATKDVAAFLCLVCDVQTGDAYKWALKIELHLHDTGEQRTLRKVNEPGLFGYSCKQRHTSAVYTCAPPPFTRSFACAWRSIISPLNGICCVRRRKLRAPHRMSCCVSSVALQGHPPQPE